MTAVGLWRIIWSSCWVLACSATDISVFSYCMYMGALKMLLIPPPGEWFSNLLVFNPNVSYLCYSWRLAWIPESNVSIVFSFWVLVVTAEGSLCRLAWEITCWMPSVSRDLVYTDLGKLQLRLAFGVALVLALIKYALLYFWSNFRPILLLDWFKLMAFMFEYLS